MKKLKWAMDGIFWEVDLTTTVTVDRVARPALEDLIPFGLSRGTSLSRPKHIDFFRRFISMPFVPSFSNCNGLSFHRLISLPLPPFARDTWFPTLLGRFDVHKFTSSLPPRQSQQQENSDASFLHTVWAHVLNPSFYALNFCSEWLLTPQDTFLLSLEKRGNTSFFSDHNLTIEAASPILFVDGLGNYWDVPFTLGLDFSSLRSSDTGMSCHFCINHTSGSFHKYDTSLVSVHVVPPSLLLGLCAKCAFSFKKNFDIWRSQAPKTKLEQPYDIFLYNLHISASATLGILITASLGENSKVFLDLTRINARVDIPSLSKFVVGASRLAMDLYNTRQAPSIDEIQAICPSASLSIQHKVLFIFRIDCGVSVDMTKKKERWYMNVINDLVYVVEYALQVIGSAKAVAWYSSTQREFMIELRFFET
ncbi:hypothetical protein ABFX02_03G025000 [Erythranthe guttata]